MRILRIILGCSFLIFVSVLLVEAAAIIAEESPQTPPLPGRPFVPVRPPVVGFDKELGLGCVPSSRSSGEKPKRINRKNAVMFVFPKSDNK